MFFFDFDSYHKIPPPDESCLVPIIMGKCHEVVSLVRYITSATSKVDHIPLYCYPRQPARMRSTSKWLWLVAAVATSTVLLICSPTRYFTVQGIAMTGVTPDASLLSRQDENAVTFDNYSLIINGVRVFLQCAYYTLLVYTPKLTPPGYNSSGEFHTFRLPVPDLWRDILEKVRAAGLNAISLYTHMGLINPSRNVIDFADWRNLTSFLQVAAELGIYIVLRPGPYIHAETSAGGTPHWVTTEVAGEVRSNASDWKEAWMPYMQSIVDQAAPYQITEGGTIVGKFPFELAVALLLPYSQASRLVSNCV